MIVNVLNSCGFWHCTLTSSRQQKLATVSDACGGCGSFHYLQYSFWSKCKVPLGTSRNLEDPTSYVWHVPWHNYCIRTWTNLQWCILCDKQGYQDPRHYLFGQCILISSILQACRVFLEYIWLTAPKVDFSQELLCDKACKLHLWLRTIREPTNEFASLVEAEPSWITMDHGPLAGSYL